MNFHSLIRVDASRRKAEKYLRLEKESSDMIDMIVRNRNFILDKKLWEADESRPPLNIYFGSDYGFCGGINFQINQSLDKDEASEKIIVGKKIHNAKQGMILKIAREDFISRYPEIEKILSGSIHEREHSEVNLIYNHFNNTSDIELRKKTIFPIHIDTGGKGKYTEDYYVEGDSNTILLNLAIAYLNYEVKIAYVNSFASENIMRQNSTSSSLKKIDEREEALRIEYLKIRSRKEFAKVIDSFVKKKGFKGDKK